MDSDRPSKPDNYSWLAPYMTVHNTDAAIKCYTEVFGFSIKECIRAAGSKRLLFARLTYQGYDILIGPDVAFSGRTGALPPSITHSRSPVLLYLYVEDVDAVHTKCVEAGLKVINPIQDMFWGDRMFKVQDPEGYHWDFATNMGAPSPEKSPVDIYYETF